MKSKTINLMESIQIYSNQKINEDENIKTSRDSFKEIDGIYHQTINGEDYVYLTPNINMNILNTYKDQPELQVYDELYFGELAEDLGVSEEEAIDIAAKNAGVTIVKVDDYTKGYSNPTYGITFKGSPSAIAKFLSGGETASFEEAVKSFDVLVKSIEGLHENNKNNCRGCGENDNDKIELPSTTNGTARKEIEDMLTRNRKRDNIKD